MGEILPTRALSLLLYESYVKALKDLLVRNLHGKSRVIINAINISTIVGACFAIKKTARGNEQKRWASL